jgi:hypothetical protein
VLFAGRPVEADVSPGAWIADSTRGRPGSTVGSFLPPVLPACVRVLHPACRYAGDDDIEVPWADVAAHNGTTTHPLMQWAGITGGWEFVHEESQPPVWDREPDEGHLPTELAARLVDVLRRHTGTPDDCWFGVWHGFGSIVADGPTLQLPGREHWLIRGPVDLATANLAPEPSEQSATLWWPADRAWCVASEIDLMSTYVGGSAACIADLLAAPRLEVLASTADDAVTHAADTLNRVPPRG